MLASSLRAGVVFVEEQTDRDDSGDTRPKHEPHTPGPVFQLSQRDDSSRPLCRPEAAMGDSERQSAHRSHSTGLGKLSEPHQTQAKQQQFEWVHSLRTVRPPKPNHGGNSTEPSYRSYPLRHHRLASPELPGFLQQLSDKQLASKYWQPSEHYDLLHRQQPLRWPNSTSNLRHACPQQTGP